MAILGIDLGTTNSLAAMWKDGKVQLIPDAFGNFMVPSVVAIDMEGNILVGQAAREEELIHPERCASNFKRFMGTEKRYSLADREFRPEELSALILKRLKIMAEEFLQEKVSECVISVPAYFNNDQRYATKLAAELAGIHCERLINEPSAAALQGRQLDDGEERFSLVFDFGGGTLDVSIVDCFENIVEITTISGDNRLGGTDFDREIALAFCRENGISQENLDEKQWIALLLESKRCKEALSEQETVEMEFQQCAMELTTEKVLHIGQGLFQRMKNVISKAVIDSRLNLSDIDNILLAGGSSRMPAVQVLLERLFQRHIPLVSRPDLLIAQGIGVYTGVKERNGEVKDIMMTDVCPFSLGIETEGEKMCMMIERNSILPSRAIKSFATAHDFQKRIAIQVYQGENYDPKQNLRLGAVTIFVPEALAGEEVIDVTFAYNINGILEVEVASRTTGEKVSSTFVSGYRHLSLEQIAAKKEQMENLQFLTEEEEVRKAVHALGERLYAETTGDLREYVSQLISIFNHFWSQGSLIRIRRCGALIMQKLLAMEMGLKMSAFEFDMEFPELEEDEES